LGFTARQRRVNNIFLGFWCKVFPCNCHFGKFLLFPPTTSTLRGYQLNPQNALGLAKTWMAPKHLSIPPLPMQKRHWLLGLHLITLNSGVQHFPLGLKSPWNSLPPCVLKQLGPFFLPPMFYAASSNAFLGIRCDSAVWGLSPPLVPVPPSVCLGPPRGCLLGDPGPAPHPYNPGGQRNFWPCRQIWGRGWAGWRGFFFWNCPPPVTLLLSSTFLLHGNFLPTP